MCVGHVFAGRFFRSVSGVSVVTVQVDFEALTELSQITIAINSQASSQLPLGIAVEYAFRLSGWQAVVYLAQNCSAFNASVVSVPQGVTCVSFGTLRTISASLPSVTPSSTFTLADRLRLRLFTTPTSLPVEVCIALLVCARVLVCIDV